MFARWGYGEESVTVVATLSLERMIRRYENVA
jgi:hypothetical protein